MKFFRFIIWRFCLPTPQLWKTLREEFWVKVLGSGELVAFCRGASWVKNFIKMCGIELWALDFKV
jgi:hypothetical protein